MVRVFFVHCTLQHPLHYQCTQKHDESEKKQQRFLQCIFPSYLPFLHTPKKKTELEYQTMGEIPFACMKRLIKAEAGNCLISEEAVHYMNDYVEDAIKEITRNARKYTDVAGRRTIMANDIQLAVEN